MRRGGFFLILSLLPLLTGCPDDGAADLEFDPLAVDFGDVPVGSEGVALVSVTNAGGAGVSLRSLTLSGDGADAFAVLAPDVPTEIAAGGAVDIELAFRPLAVGAASAVLTVVADLGPAVLSEDASGGGSWELSLTGAGVEAAPTDADGDGYDSEASGGDDCDDTNSSIHPGAEELCDGIDNDCNGEVDDDVGTDEECNGLDDDCDGVIDNDLPTSDWFPDADGDSFGDASADPVPGCDAPDDDHVLDDTDCDDTSADVHPGAEEIAGDGIDQNCDGSDSAVCYTDADGDGHGDVTAPLDSADGDCDDAGEAATGLDCDDSEASVHPDAVEVPDDGVDQDCSGEDAVTCLTDGDGDGFGDDGAPVVSTDDDCEDAGEAAPTDGGDCDDAEASVYPGAPEIADDGVDQDCDGFDTVTCLADADTDGYGDDATTVASADGDCDDAGEVPLGDGGDCDDANDTVFPGAPEIADDGVDQDCDGFDAVTCLTDGDGDGYGDDDAPLTSADGDCDDAGEVPTTDGGDCDDGDATAYPGAPEIVDDGIDQDCNGFDVVTCLGDADGDGWGDASIVSTDGDCDDAGEVPPTDGGDCDDLDAAVNPDAPEVWDGVDNDCDGGVDNALHTGSGADGDLVVAGTVDLSATGLMGAWAVVSIDGTNVTVTVDSTPLGLVPGDEVLVLNVHGSDAAHAAAGTYEFATVDSVSGVDVGLLQPLASSFGEVDNTDLTDQDIVLQRVPHFGDVTVPVGSLLTTSAWDGSVGGVLAFRAAGTVLVEDGGAISVDELGFWGGATGGGYNCDSFQGESYAGAGDGEGDGNCSYYNESTGQWAPNYGGGGAHITGGGGNYGGGALGGDSWTGGSATPPEPGLEYGDADLSTWFLGSGGGGVWNGGDNNAGEDPGPGGDGAGLLYVGAASVDVAGTAGLSAIGQTTYHWAWGSWTYGAGGGSGGTIHLEADAVVLAADAVDATGGFGETTHVRLGGDGGVGRIRIDCGTCNGFAHGTPEADDALNAGAEPDPGFTAPIP